MSWYSILFPRCGYCKPNGLFVTSSFDEQLSKIKTWVAKICEGEDDTVVIYSFTKEELDLLMPLLKERTYEEFAGLTLGETEEKKSAITKEKFGKKNVLELYHFGEEDRTELDFQYLGIEIKNNDRLVAVIRNVTSDIYRSILGSEYPHCDCYMENQGTFSIYILYCADNNHPSLLAKTHRIHSI
jgi:hypothetical protein